MSETLWRRSGCFYEILLQSALVKQMRVKPREICLCEQSKKLCVYTCMCLEGLESVFFRYMVIQT